MQSVIQRKAEAGRAAPEAPPMTASRALGLALAKAAQDDMSLQLRVAQLTERRLSLAELPEALAERALLAVLEGPSEGLGLAAVAPSLLSALIEMQTTGRLGAAPPPPRRPTRTDAAMVAGFLDHVLEGLEQTIAELPDVVWAGGFRYASYLDDPRPLGLMLEDAGFRVLQIELALGPDGARKGDLLLAFPANGRGPAPRPAPRSDGHDAPPERGAPAEAARWKDDLERAVLQVPATLEAVLHRLTLPLAAVLTFAPGTELPVPLAALEELQLEGLGGRLVGRGRLGQNRGFRAVRLASEAEETASPSAVPPLPEAAEAPPRRRATPPPRPEPAPRPAPDPLPMAAMGARLPMASPMGSGGLHDGGASPGDEGEGYAMPPLKIGSVF